MTTHRTIVTAGPTIDAHAIHAILPNAEVVAPIAFGDAGRYRLRAGDRLLIIDGLFLQRPSVRHKELLSLLADGVDVSGASSMGALRAAELHEFGMRGFGAVFAGYRDGTLDADDEVGMVHGDAGDGYPVFVDALVNMRATLTAAHESGILSATDARLLLECARRMPFTARAWPHVLRTAGLASDRVGDLARQLRDARVDIKRADAITALHALQDPDLSTSPRRRALPPPTMWTVRWARAAAQSPPSTPNGTGPSAVSVSDDQLLTFVRLCADPTWQYRPALEQVAAWHQQLTDGRDEAAPAHIAADALAAIRALDAAQPGHRHDSTVRKLERIAHQHAQARGITAPDGTIPPAVQARWLTGDEIAACEQDPARAAALLAARTLVREPAIAATEHLLAALAANPRVEQWRAGATDAIAFGRRMAREHPELDLRTPRPDKLDQLFAAHWGVDELGPELVRRGFSTRTGFHRAVVPFAAAAAAGRLPKIRVDS